MIGIDRKTGQEIIGFEQFVSRFVQVMTTLVGTREKRPKFGSMVPTVNGINVSPSGLIKAQSYVIAAFYVAENGLSDFTVNQVVATPHSQGILLRVSGIWRTEQREFEVPISAIAA